MAAHALHDDAEGDAELLALAGAPSLMANLKFIIDQTGAEIVLSSTWRLEAATRSAVKTRLKTVGLSFIDSTPDLAAIEDGATHFELCAGDDGEYSPEAERAIEIRRWLAARSDDDVAIPGFVAIDDMNLCLGSLEPANFVQTDDSHGLTRLGAESSIAKLYAQRATSAECLCASRRFDFLPPSLSRDAAVLQLYNDKETMLPALPQLCPMSSEAMAQRRSSHRGALERGTSCFMDIVHRSSGELIGTAGFREVHKEGRRAEWGIVVKRAWQRRGVCSEAFISNALYAREALGCELISAATLNTNVPMRTFFAKAGMKHTSSKCEQHGEQHLEWLAWWCTRSASRTSSGKRSHRVACWCSLRQSQPCQA